MAVCRFAEMEISEKKVEELLKSSQSQLLVTLFNCSNRKAIRFLKKITGDTFSEKHYQILRTAMQSNELIDCLKHQPQVPVDLIPILLTFKPLRNPKMVGYWINRSLESGSDLWEEAQALQSTWNSCRLAARVLRIEQIDKHMQRCKTPTDVENLHDKWEAKKQVSINYLTAERKSEEQEQEAIRQLTTQTVSPDNATPARTRKTRRRARSGPGQQNQTSLTGATPQRRKGEFPPPPFQGNDFIQPILTAKELVAEGCKQRNCIASYKKRVRDGKSFFYRFVEPRITIELRFRYRRWELHDMKLACNNRPPDTYRQIIESWFESSLHEKKMEGYREMIEQQEKEIINRDQLTL